MPQRGSRCHTAGKSTRRPLATAISSCVSHQGELTDNGSLSSNAKRWCGSHLQHLPILFCMRFSWYFLFDYKFTKNNRDSQEKSRQNSHYCYLLFQIVSERFSASFRCRNFAVQFETRSLSASKQGPFLCKSFTLRLYCEPASARESSNPDSAFLSLKRSLVSRIKKTTRRVNRLDTSKCAIRHVKMHNSASLSSREDLKTTANPSAVYKTSPRRMGGG